MFNKKLERFCLALTLGAATLTVPAQAASCWTDQAASAAKVRDLETMLMVSALRCRLSGNDFLEEYNGFVRASRPVLINVNEELRAHFANAVGKAGALNAYDRYVTSIANGYGGGVAGLDCRDMQSILGAASAAGHSRGTLEDLADRARANPALPGGRCRMSIAESEDGGYSDGVTMAAR